MLTKATLFVVMAGALFFWLMRSYFKTEVGREYMSRDDPYARGHKRTMVFVLAMGSVSLVVLVFMFFKVL